MVPPLMRQLNWPFTLSFLVTVVAYSVHLYLAPFVRHAAGLGSGVDAFSPFMTLTALFHSLICCQMYQYYFDRNGAIQESVFREIATLQRFLDCCRMLCKHAKPQDTQAMCDATYAYGEELLRSLDESATYGDVKQLGSVAELYSVVERLGVVLGQISPELQPAMAVHFEKATDAIYDLTSTRSGRMSQMTAQLPTEHWWTLRVVVVLVVGSFLLVDLAHSHLEAVIFATVSGTSVLIDLVIADLADPFSGVWNVGPASEATRQLLGTLRDNQRAYVLMQTASAKGAWMKRSISAKDDAAQAAKDAADAAAAAGAAEIETPRASGAGAFLQAIRGATARTAPTAEQGTKRE